MVAEVQDDNLLRAGDHLALHELAHDADGRIPTRCEQRHIVGAAHALEDARQRFLLDDQEQPVILRGPRIGVVLARAGREDFLPAP